MDEQKPPEQQVVDAPASRAHGFLYYSLFLLLPLIGFAVMESWLDRKNYDKTYGWMTVDDFGADKVNKFIFVGTSRTICAVNEAEFYNTISPYYGSWYFGQNMGTGATKMAFHYLGLRNLYEEAPDSIEGTVFLVEAPAELPDYSYWTDRWWYPSYENRIVFEFRPRDFRTLWESNMTRDEKLDMTMRVVLRDWTTFHRREQVRFEFVNWGEQRVKELLSAVTGKPIPVPEALEDVKTAGGVVNDAKVAQTAEQKFQEYVDQEKDYLDRPWQDWDATIVADFVEMVHENGGQVVFFDVPQPSNFDERIYHTEQRNKDREAFRRQCEQWGTPFIRADFEYTDGDFPDHFHLSLAKSVPYSRALAETYMLEVLKLPAFLEEQGLLESEPVEPDSRRPPGYPGPEGGNPETGS